MGLKHKHEIVNSGFDIERFKTADWPADLERLLDARQGAEKPIVLAMLAALEPRKRHLEMLEALSDVIASNPQVHLLLAGEGSLKDEISQRVKTLNIESQVQLLGYRSDPEKILAMSDICLLASGQEGLPRSVLQYVAAGKPVVLFNLPGVSVVAKNDKNAFVIPMDDWSKFGEAVQKLVTDPALRQKMGAATQHVDISPWDWREMGSKTDAFYEEVIVDQK